MRRGLCVEKYYYQSRLKRSFLKNVYERLSIEPRKCLYFACECVCAVCISLMATDYIFTILFFISLCPVPRCVLFLWHSLFIHIWNVYTNYATRSNILLILTWAHLFFFFLSFSFIYFTFSCAHGNSHALYWQLQWQLDESHRSMCSKVLSMGNF